MIHDALAAYLRSNTSLNVYLNQAPLDSIPCIVIDDGGDARARHWDDSGVVTGLIDQEYELTIWYDLENGGGRVAAQQAETIISLLDNFAGPMTDTAASPTVTHRIAHIEASSGGAGFNEAAELYGQGIFLTVTYT